MLRQTPLSGQFITNVLILHLQGMKAACSGHFIRSSFSREGSRAHVKIQKNVCAFLLLIWLCQFNFWRQPRTLREPRKTSSSLTDANPIYRNPNDYGLNQGGCQIAGELGLRKATAVSKKWCWAVSQGRCITQRARKTQLSKLANLAVSRGVVSALPICPPCHCSGVLSAASCKYLQLSTGGRSLARLVKVGRRKLASLGIALS